MVMTDILTVKEAARSLKPLVSRSAKRSKNKELADIDRIAIVSCKQIQHKRKLL